jgi:hypothetical protein
MANWWYYNEDGEKVGIITDRQLKKLARDGIIAPGTVVETEDGRTGLAKDVIGLTFAESVLALQPTLRPHNEVGFAPPDTGEVYDLTLPSPPPEPPAPPEPSDVPNPSVEEDSFTAFLSDVSQAAPSSPVVENTSPTKRKVSRWDWETLYNRSILSVLAFLCLIAVFMVTAAFLGVKWYRPASPQQAVQQAQQVAGAGQQQQNAVAIDESPPPFENIFEAAAHFIPTTTGKKEAYRRERELPHKTSGSVRNDTLRCNSTIREALRRSRTYS